jgi:DNA-directed RNA polymerase specialized sigma24 family protein
MSSASRPALSQAAPAQSPLASKAARSYSTSDVAEISSRVVAICLAVGLQPSDAEDVSQDIFLWLLRMGSPALALCGPWLAAVARNFILRHRRQRGRLTAHEGTPLGDIAEPAAGSEYGAFESRQFLDRMAELLPQPERELLLLVRRGFTVIQAARSLGIPRGSCDYHRKRLIDLARSALAAGSTAEEASTHRVHSAFSSIPSSDSRNALTPGAPVRRSRTVFPFGATSMPKVRKGQQRDSRSTHSATSTTQKAPPAESAGRRSRTKT